MTDDNKNAYETEAKDAEAANEAVAETPAATPEAEAPPALDPLEVLKAEHLDLKDKYLRLAAEMDNLRRRTVSLNASRNHQHFHTLPAAPQHFQKVADGCTRRAGDKRDSPGKGRQLLLVPRVE